MSEKTAVPDGSTDELEQTRVSEYRCHICGLKVTVAEGEDPPESNCPSCGGSFVNSREGVAVGDKREIDRGVGFDSNNSAVGTVDIVEGTELPDDYGAEPAVSQTLKEWAGTEVDRSFACLGDRLVRHGEEWVYVRSDRWYESKPETTPWEGTSTLRELADRTEGVTYLGDGRLGTFLLAVSREMRESSVGHDRRREVSLDSQLLGGSDPSDRERPAVEAARVPAVVGTGPTYRLAAFLAGHGYSNGELSDLLAVKRETVKSNLSRYKNKWV